MPFPVISPFNPLVSPIGEMTWLGFPDIQTSPGGGSTVKRKLICLQQDVFSWMVYFSSVAPIDPYCLNSNLWTMGQKPFQEQYSTQGLASIFGPAYAQYQLSVLDLVYESQGMRFYTGQGVVKEQMKPRMEQEPTGVVRTYGGIGMNSTDIDATKGGTLYWNTNDSKNNNAVYFGEHPHFESGGSEFIMTFPFAPTQNEPLRSGMININAWTSFVIGYTFPPNTLKYIGMASEASVVIPAVGAFTGLQRWNKSFLFHYRNPIFNTRSIEVTVPGGTVGWNDRFRARDQTWNHMKDMDGDDYLQYLPFDFASFNWFL